MREIKTAGTENYRHLVEALPAAVFFTDAQANISIWNEAAAQISGLSSEDVVGKTLTETGLNPAIRDFGLDAQVTCCLRSYLHNLKEDSSGAKEQIFSLCTEMEQRNVNFTCRTLYSEVGLLGVVGVASSEANVICSSAGAVGYAEGITETPAHQYSVLDATALFDALKRDWYRYQRYQNVFSILSLEIDYYTNFEAVFGVSAAADMIKLVLSSIGTSMRRSDIIGRVAPHRFMILLSNSDRKSALKVANMLLDNIRQQSCLDLPFAMTASIGVVSVEDRQSLEKTLDRADNALRRAVEMGRNQVTFWG